jgi:hypothetical protein
VNVRWAVPIIILAVVFLPLPFAVALAVFGVILAVRPRGEPEPARAVLARPAGPVLFRGPPR